MSTDTTWQTGSSSSEATLRLGEAIGQKCRGGEIFEFISDLGGGKTTFVKGLAKGLGSKDQVASPTFMVERVYSGRLPLHHFDFYRLGEAGIVGQELAEAMEDATAVIAVEWGRVVDGVLPDHRIRIAIEPTGNDTMNFTFTFPAARAYLFDEVKA
jgi:tRNA threonylcarbamoyladenosine biosynthesis protein TsaE